MKKGSIIIGAPIAQEGRNDMDDQTIIALFFQRDESALKETAQKYTAYCRNIALHLLSDQQDADEEGGDAHHPQKAGAGGVAAGIEGVHDGLCQHRETHAHGNRHQGGDAHGVLRHLAGAALIPDGQGRGDGRHDGDGEGRDEGGGKIEQGLGLAVDPVEHLGLLIVEARGALKPVHAELGVHAV